MMDPLLTRLFIYELKHQCKFADMACTDLVDSISPINEAKVWSSLQSFLIASANISKIFWPTKKYENRGEELRQLLSVKDDAKFRLRDPRNHLEHFDERLEDWYAGSTLHNIADTIICPSNMMIGGTMIDHMRVFITDKFSFKFRGDEYNITAIYQSIVELSGKITDELKSRGIS